jgi:hypothetical protein
LIGDPLLAQTLAARARERVDERHSWPVVAERTAAVYEAALAAPAEPVRSAAGHRVVVVPSGNLLAGAPTYGSAPPDASDDADDDVFDLAELDAVAGDAAWTVGVRAARAAVHAEVARAAAARETAEREAAGRVAADALDIVLASTHRV